MNIDNYKTSLISMNKPFLTLFAVLAFISALNIPILITLWRHGFDDGTYSHAFLIPFISAYLYYQLAVIGKLQFRDKVSLPFTLLLVASCYLLFITANAQISIGYWFSLLLVYLVSIPMVYRFNWHILFPAAFLIFIFPFWGSLTLILQNISVAAVTFFMSFTDVPTYVEAQLVTIPAGVFEIAGGCSGLRYLIVSLAISSLFIFLNIRSPKRALMFLMVAILGALLTNWIRITALILIGEYSNMESSLMDDHNTFGWYLYIPFMVLLFSWGNKLTDFDLLARPSTNSTNKKKPNQLIILCLIFLSVVSSTTLKTETLPSFSTKAVDAELLNTIIIDNHEPRVHYYSSIETVNIPNNDTNTYYTIYHFNGNDLDGKPSFYDNNLIPNGWNIAAQSTNKNWLVYTIYKGKIKALILVKYEIDKETTNQNKAFKIKRLAKALTGLNETKLHWVYTLCEVSCEGSLVAVQQLLAL